MFKGAPHTHAERGRPTHLDDGFVAPVSSPLGVEASSTVQTRVAVTMRLSKENCFTVAVGETLDLTRVGGSKCGRTSVITT